MVESAEPGEELWTTGQVAHYLRDLGVTRRQVSRLVIAGELPAVQPAAGRWRRVPARAARAYRQRLLEQLAKQDRAGRRR